MVNLGELVMILNFARQGLSASAIARQTGNDCKTIRKYIDRGLEPPAYKPPERIPSLIRPSRAFLQKRVSPFPNLTGQRPWREIREIDFTCGYSTVTEFLRDVRPAAEPALFERPFERSFGHRRGCRSRVLPGE
ncbi:MAG: hypothetical protein ACRYFU_13135 [Janthinobacterium lividum]